MGAQGLTPNFRLDTGGRPADLVIENFRRVSETIDSNVLSGGKGGFNPGFHHHLSQEKEKRENPPTPRPKL